jgi:hypothetical protein
MPSSLLDRQLSLVKYMTSGDAIFGGERDASSIQALQGIDGGLLQVEARFSYAKRMEKITAVLPKTFELLEPDREAMVREFVEGYPPSSISRLENARQFHAFLSQRWMREVPSPPYISDVAACELACAELDADVEDPDAALEQQVSPPRGAIRRGRAVALLRCAYDVRPIFETDVKQVIPTRRETRVVVALPSGVAYPQVFEVHPAVFDLLAALNDWTDPSALGVGAELATLLPDLTAAGLVEVWR